MKHKVLWFLGILIASALFTGCCGLIPPQGAVSFAKADLAARAEENSVEITEIQVEDYYEAEPSPADRANGVQSYASFTLHYACRCSGDEQWLDCRNSYALRKVNGEWERDPEFPGGNTYGMPNCTGPTPIPFD